MSACTGQPVSWLVLERYALGELSSEQGRAVAEHLAACPACRACREQIASDARDFTFLTRALPLPAAGSHAPRRSTRRSVRSVWLALAGTCAAALLVLRVALAPEAESGATSPGVGAGTKGGEVALELVRRDARGRLLEPVRFAASDRWKALVTCPPSLQGPVRVQIFQGGQVFEPLPEQPLSCGNGRALTGAWQLDGAETAEVCVVFPGNAAERLAGARNASALAALGLPHACATLAPD